jgi:aldehyde dehydrogenase (NAD+)
VLDYVGTGVAEGARLVCGGQRPAHLAKGYYVEPTLFADVDRATRIAQEEIFGPVLSVIPVDDEADAIRAANDSSFGLYGAVFTHDRDAAYRVAGAMRTGTVTHNIFRFDPFLPFGGFKQSGIGRGGGVESITSYTELKSILLDAPA